jgi:hypothetical protein
MSLPFSKCLRQGRHTALAAVALAVLGLADTAALGQTTVTGTGNLATLTGVAAPPSGSAWALGNEGIYMSSNITLPAGGAFTLAGNGNTLTLNNGAASGYFVNSAAGAYTVNLDNITLTGANNNASGAVISLAPSTNSALNLNLAGPVTLSNNQTTTTATAGGSLIHAGTVNIVGDGSNTLTLQNNTDTISGGTTKAITTEASISISNLGALTAIGSGFSANFNGVSIDAGAISITDSHSSATSVAGAIATTSTNNSDNVTLGAGDTTQVTLTGNQSQGGYGGVVATHGLLSITGANVNVSGNHAQSYGGAIWATGGAAIHGQSITLDDNHSLSATLGGGAIFARSAVVIGDAGVTNTVTLTNNSAGGVGGAIQTYSATSLTINGAAIDISNNSVSAPSSYGGAIMVGGDAVIGNPGSTVTASGNTADGYGGVIYVDSSSPGSATINGSAITLTGNSAASGYGGAVAVTLAAPVTIGNADSVLAISRNASPFGGAVLTFGDLTLNGGGQITNNTADPDGSGGALYTAGNLTLNASTARGLTFSGNTPDAVMLDNGVAGMVAALNATAGNIVFQDPIETSAVNLSTVIASGPKAVVFDSAASASYVYAATTARPGVTFAVQNGAVYGGIEADFSDETNLVPTSFSAAGATLSGGGAGTVRADSVSLSGGTLDISGSSSLLANPAGTAAGGFSTFNLVAGSGGVNLGGATVLVNLCGNKQLADQLNLATGGSGPVTGAATLAITQVSGCTGAGTTGNGILIVQSDSPTNGLFTTPAGSTVTVSGYDYILNQVGNNWYLKSNAPVAASPAAPIPTLGETALALLALLLGGCAALTLRRKAPRAGEAR